MNNEAWVTLRMLEFSNEIATLVAAGEDRLTAGAMAVGSLCVDVADLCGTDPMETYHQLIAACAERSALANPDPIIVWLRSKMEEPTL